MTATIDAGTLSAVTPPANDLRGIASLIRARIVENSHRTGTPHLGSCLSCVDILSALYFNVLRIDPKNPRDPERDRFILSKGHGAPGIVPNPGAARIRSAIDAGRLSRIPFRAEAYRSWETTITGITAFRRPTR